MYSKLRSSFILIALLGFALFIKGETIIDSLEIKLQNTEIGPEYILILSQLSHHSSRIDIDMSFRYLHIADSLSKEINLAPEYEGALFSSYLTAHENKGNHNDAILYGKRALTSYLQSNDSSQIANLYYKLSTPYMNMGEWEEAQNYIIQSINIYEKLKDRASLANSLNSLGAVMKELKNYEKANLHYKRSLSIYRILNDENALANVLNNLGNLEAIHENYDIALSYYKEQEQYDKRANFEWGLGYLYESMSTLYLKKGEFETAADYAKKSLEIREKLGQRQEYMISTLKYANALEKLNLPREALSHYEDGLKMAEDLGSKFWRAEGYKGAADTYSALSKHKLAFEYLKSFVVINDSLLSEKTINVASDLEAKYDTQQKEQEIALLESQKALANQTISSQKKISFISLGAGGLLALLSIFLFRLLQQNKSQKLQLQQSVKDKDYLLREIHHRVKNNLQVISSLLYLQSEKLTDPIAQDAINVGRGRVKSMALIHQNLYGVDQSSQISLKKYLEDLAVELFDSYNLMGESIDLELNIEDVAVDVEILVPLGLIINELISNALKYAYDGRDKGVLQISAISDQGKLKVQVKDDGVGMKEKSKREGSFGTELIESFVDQLEAKINTVSKDGIEINIEIPLKNAV